MGQFRRKTPISGKQKKAQLKLKKQQKSHSRNDCSSDDDLQGSGDEQQQTVVVEGAADTSRLSHYTNTTFRVNQQPQRDGRANARNRFNLHFSRERLDAEFEKGKREMHQLVTPKHPRSLEYCSEDFFPEGMFFPERPKGYQNMSVQQLDMKENETIRLFCEEIHAKFGQQEVPPNMYEENIETWRQLWRVIERSHVLLFITDIRFSVCQFPPYVYSRLRALNKKVILVLNKIDLVPASLVVAWKRYFTNLCPGIEVIGFCSHERTLERHRRARLAIHSCRTLINAIEKVTGGSVDLSSWSDKLEKEALTMHEEQQQPVIEYTAKTKLKRKARRARQQQKQFNEDEDEEDSETEQDPNEADEHLMSTAFTIGTIGYPNVGKSSLINAIMGRKMVGVSPTPGHTKHFQTHYLTQKKDILLCDCPGLVFPALCSYNVQVLSGTFPIAQVRCPMAVVGYLASHINLPRILGINLPADFKDPSLPDRDCWTAFAISEGYSIKRQYISTKGGRPNTSRGANELLRFSVAARNKLILALKPRGYHDNLADYQSDSECEAVKVLQGVHAEGVELTSKLLSHGWRGDHVPETVIEESENESEGESVTSMDDKECRDNADEVESEETEEKKEEMRQEGGVKRKNNKKKNNRSQRCGNKFAVLVGMEGDSDD